MIRYVSSSVGQPMCRSQQGKVGAVLIMVLIVLGMLSLGAYTFSETMLFEYRALRAGTDETRTRAASDSGITAVVAALASTRAKDLAFADLASSPQLSWKDSLGDEYSVRIYSGAFGTRWALRGGPLDESAKLNVNGLNLNEEHQLESRQRLLAIPGMTPQAADSLLDWIDPDEVEREYGAESNWYLSQGLPYTPRQDAIRSLQEMLLVRGIHAAQLLGEDTNANGWLDLQEDDGELSLPSDNRDHFLDAGWSQWLSVHAAESNLSSLGTPKINVNQDNLVKLFRDLDTQLGTEAARFIVALRMNGPMDNDGVGRFDSPEEIAKRRASAPARSRQQRSESKSFAEFQPESINGFAINRAARFPINSTVDLIGRRTEAMVDDREVILASPWSDNAQRIEAALNVLEDQLTTVSGKQRIGRINIHLADREILMTIPNLTSDLASVIIKSRSATSTTKLPSIGWLYRSGLVDLLTLRNLAPYMTSGGDVYTGISVGTVAGVRQATAAMFLVDATAKKPVLRFQEYHATRSSSVAGTTTP